MTASLKFFGIAFFAMLTFGCSKQADMISPEDLMVKYLTSEAGNRVWRISKIYENGIEKPLTTDQVSYTKTYTIGTSSPVHSGSFVDSDGYKGQWVLSSTVTLIETITNNPAGNISFQIIINSLTDHAMDVQYTLNGKTIRTLYYAF